LIKLSARFTSVLSVYIIIIFKVYKDLTRKKNFRNLILNCSHANLEFVFFGRYKLLISFLAISWLEFIIRFVLSLSLSLCQFFSISPLLVDYARRTKLFFSSIRRDYRLQRKRCVIRPEGGRKKARKQREIQRVNGWNRVRKERTEETKRESDEKRERY